MKTNIVMVLTGLLILLLVNLSIWQKQVHLSQGEVIYLELAPVDPRSLMQGDFMALSYTLGNKLQSLVWGSREISQQDNFLTLRNDDINMIKGGYVVVEKDANQVAQFVRLGDAESISENQRKLQFRIRNDRVKFATNAFFFEEGDEPLYTEARYGVFRLNEKGEVLLTGLLDEQYNLLGKN